MIEDDNERKIWRLEKKISNLENTIQQLKKERHEALDLAEHYRTKGAQTSSTECQNCKENAEQYKKMRAAFERRKQDQEAISSCLKSNEWYIDRERLTITKLIKLGKERA